MNSTVCALCHTNKYAEVLYPANFHTREITPETFSARRIPDRIHYQLLICKKCSLIFSSPILAQKTINDLYGKSDYNYSDESMLLANTYGRFLQKILPKKGRENLILLDIGCGNGFFLEKVKELGIKRIFGLEPGKASVDKARKDIKKHIRINVLHDHIFKNNSFDIICCFHTLDHVIDPNSFLQIAYKLLKKNGKILFVTHDTHGLSVKLFKEKSPIFDIEHIYLFNKKTLRMIFENNYFKKCKIYNLHNTYHVSYWAKLLPFPKKIKGILSYFLTLTLIERIPLSIPAGNIAIIAEK